MSEQKLGGWYVSRPNGARKKPRIPADLPSAALRKIASHLNFQDIKSLLLVAANKPDPKNPNMKNSFFNDLKNKKQENRKNALLLSAFRDGSKKRIADAILSATRVVESLVSEAGGWNAANFRGTIDVQLAKNAEGVEIAVFAPNLRAPWIQVSWTDHWHSRKLVELMYSPQTKKWTTKYLTENQGNQVVPNVFHALQDAYIRDVVASVLRNIKT